MIDFCIQIKKNGRRSSHEAGSQANCAGLHLTFPQAAEKCADARRPKSFVGNGFKPFPTDARRNEPALSLPKGRMRGGVARNKERLFATPPRR